MQIDDAYLGGKRNGGKPRRDSENKLAFLIAVETDAELEHPACVVIEPVRTFDNTALTDWAERRLAPDAEAYTGHAHTVLETGGGRAARSGRGDRRERRSSAAHRACSRAH